MKAFALFAVSAMRSRWGLICSPSCMCPVSRRNGSLLLDSKEGSVKSVVSQHTLLLKSSFVLWQDLAFDVIRTMSHIIISHRNQLHIT